MNEEVWSDLFKEVADNITYKDGYELLLLQDKILGSEGRWYYQVQCLRPDAITGCLGYGRGGKSYLSPNVTRSELITKAFGLFKSYEEHECREFFKYQGKQPFGPHIDVMALLEVCDRTEHRGDQV